MGILHNITLSFFGNKVTRRRCVLRPRFMENLVRLSSLGGAFITPLIDGSSGLLLVRLCRLLCLRSIGSCAFGCVAASLHSVATFLPPLFDGSLGLPPFWVRRFLSLWSMASCNFGRIATSLHSVSPLLAPSVHDTLRSWSTCDLPPLGGAAS